MSKYKLIEELGISVITFHQTKISPDGITYAFADDLLKVLESGVRVYGELSDWSNKPTNVGVGIYEKMTHSGLLINYKPIEKPEPVTKEEIDRALNEDASIHLSQTKVLENWRDLLVKIQKNGIKS